MWKKYGLVQRLCHRNDSPLADEVALVYKFRHSNDTNFLTVHKYDVGVQ